MGRSSLARVVLLVLAILVAAESVLSQGAHSLQGKVLMPNGTQPATPVKIKLTLSGRPVYETFTDLSGRFSFTGLIRGRYQLTAEGDGQTFETTRVDAEILAFGSAPQSFTQNVVLRPKAGKTVAAAAVTSIEALDPNLPQPARETYEKGLKRAESNKPEQAIKLFLEAIEAYPAFQSAHVALGEQYDKIKRYAEAESAYKRAVELKNESASAQAGLGVVLVKQKKYAEAIPPLRRSVEINNQSSVPHLFLGLAEMMTGDYEAAEKNLLRAYEIGKPTVAHIYLANLYELQRRPAKAIDELQAFLRENPESPSSSQIREAIEKLRKQIPNKK